MKSLKEGALAAANAARAAIGYPPVDHLYPGYRQMATSCPITNTVYDDDIDRTKYYVATGGFGISISEDVTGWRAKRRQIPISNEAWLFIREFDKGFFPELEIRPTL